MNFLFSFSCVNFGTDKLVKAVLSYDNCLTFAITKNLSSTYLEEIVGFASGLSSSSIFYSIWAICR